MKCVHGEAIDFCRHLAGNVGIGTPRFSGILSQHPAAFRFTRHHPGQARHSTGSVGKGQPIGFRMLDTDYTGNDGVVHVDVTCAVQRQK